MDRTVPGTSWLFHKYLLKTWIVRERREWMIQQAAKSTCCHSHTYLWVILEALIPKKTEFPLNKPETCQKLFSGNYSCPQVKNDFISLMFHTVPSDTGWGFNDEIFWVVAKAGCMLDGYGEKQTNMEALNLAPHPRKGPKKIKLMCVGGRRERGSREPEQVFRGKSD